MRSFIIVATIFALAPAISLADQPLPGGTFTLTGVEVKPIERTRTDDGKINDKVSDKLTYWIRFDVHPTYTVKQSPSFSITNPTVVNKTKLTLDKPVKFKGKVVPAGANLLEFKKFDGSFFNVHVPKLTPLAIHSAAIKSGFESRPTPMSQSSNGQQPRARNSPIR